MIYFIQADTGGPIKIGHSLNAIHRLHMLQTANPNRLVLLRTIDGDFSTEANLHRQLALHNIRGEWFADVPLVRRAMMVGTRVKTGLGGKQINFRLDEEEALRIEREAKRIPYRTISQWLRDVVGGD